MNVSSVVTSSFLHSRSFRVAVEGNIGSGKSTFLAYCKRQSDVEVVEEPVNVWTNLDGTNLLGKFYEEPRQWSMAFQSYVTLTTIRNHLRPCTKLLRLTERSIYSSRHCFVQALCENSLLAPGMASVLSQWYEFADEAFAMRPDAIVYIRTSPDVAHGRMLGRARSEEATVSLQYLQQLDRLHGEWIAREHAAMMDGTSDTMVFTLNGDLPLVELTDKYEECLSHLRILTL